MTNLPNRARLAGLVTLALTLATACVPAEASGLKLNLGMGNGHDSLPIAIGSGSSSSDKDCLSRHDIEDYFSEKGLHRISVQRADKHDLYLVSGYMKPAEKVEQLQPDLKSRSLSQMGSSDHKSVYYLVVFDACRDKIVQYIEPQIAM